MEYKKRGDSSVFSQPHLALASFPCLSLHLSAPPVWEAMLVSKGERPPSVAYFSSYDAGCFPISKIIRTDHSQIFSLVKILIEEPDRAYLHIVYCLRAVLCKLDYQERRRTLIARFHLYILNPAINLFLAVHVVKVPRFLPERHADNQTAEEISQQKQPPLHCWPP